MGTTLEETEKTVREALIYALQCGIDRDELRLMMHEASVDLMHNRLEPKKKSG